MIYYINLLYKNVKNFKKNKDKYIPTVESWCDHLAPNDKDVEYQDVTYKDIFTKDEIFSIDLSDCDRIYSKYGLFKYL